MTDEELSPEEYGRDLANQTSRAMNAQLPAIQMAAAVHACLHQLVMLLIEKKVLEPQETLDAFARASDDIQRQPDSELAVRIVEDLCSAIAKIPGAKRGSA